MYLEAFEVFSGASELEYLCWPTSKFPSAQYLMPAEGAVLDTRRPRGKPSRKVSKETSVSWVSEVRACTVWGGPRVTGPVTLHQPLRSVRTHWTPHRAVSLQETREKSGLFMSAWILVGRLDRTTPALAGRFFTTSAIQKAHSWNTSPVLNSYCFAESIQRLPHLHNLELFPLGSVRTTFYSQICPPDLIFHCYQVQVSVM